MAKARKPDEGENNNAVPEEEPSDARGFTIPRPEWRPATVRITGISTLIQHKWSEKAIRALEGAQTGKPKEQRKPKVPMEEALAAAYIVPGMEDAPNEPGKFYHPDTALKHAFLYGIAQLGDRKFPKTKATGWMFIESYLRLTFERVTQRMDITRDPTQVTYRLEFHEWGGDFDISYNPNSISLEQIAGLLDLGGVGGIGEWRPSAPKNKAGSHGRFTVTGAG